MRKLIFASLLVLTLSGLTYAGVMPTPAPDPQLVSATRNTTREISYGHIPNGRAAGGTAAAVTEVLLGLLRGVLPLF